jgi:hypothetical protein
MEKGDGSSRIVEVNGMARVKSNVGFLDPHDEFVFGEQDRSVLDIADRWAKSKEERDSIVVKARIEKWENQRKMHMEALGRERARKYREGLAGVETEELVEATKKQRLLAKSLQTVYTSYLKRSSEGQVYFSDRHGVDMECKVSDLIRALEKGINLERKILGFSDEVVRVQIAADVSEDVFEVVSKYVDDPAVLRNIGRDLEEKLAKRYEFIQELKKKG